MTTKKQSASSSKPISRAQVRTATIGAFKSVRSEGIVKLTPAQRDHIVSERKK